MTAPQTVLARSLDLDRGQEGGMVRQSLQSAMPPWAASELRQVVRQRGEVSLSQVPLLAGTETFSPPSMQLLGKFQLHGVNCFSSPRSQGETALPPPRTVTGSPREVPSCCLHSSPYLSGFPRKTWVSAHTTHALAFLLYYS